MKKTWILPQATPQVFAPNDYVSACTMQLNCDLCANTVGDGKTYPRLHITGPAVGGALDGQTFHMAYQTCGDQYIEVECGDLSKVTITDYLYYSEVEGSTGCAGSSGKITHWLVPMENSIEAYLWKDSSNDYHATLANFDTTKS